MRAILTGGGTGGHIIPNLSVIEELKSKGYNDILYIGQKNSIEQKMLAKEAVAFEGISCGKLRRYFSVKNFTDIFKVPIGIFQSCLIIKKYKPDVIFSKGGFVGFPVVVAGFLCGIKTFVHESDLNFGLANKMSFPFAHKILLSHAESKKNISPRYKKKCIVTGNPVRKSILNGDPIRGIKFTGLNKFRPVILVMGGSTGATKINHLIKQNLDKLLKKYQIIHLTGRGNLDISIHKPGYVQYEFLNEQLKDVLNIADLIITRGGANALFETALLRKKAIVFPLGAEVSRGEQVKNAQVFAKKTGWQILSTDIGYEDFIKAIELGMKNPFNPAGKYLNGTEKIAELLIKTKKNK